MVKGAVTINSQPAGMPAVPTLLLRVSRRRLPPLP